MDQQKQLQSLSNEYQSLQNGTHTYCASALPLSIENVLIFGRHEQSGHSTPEARKPAARKQGSAEGTAVSTFEALLLEIILTT